MYLNNIEINKFTDFDCAPDFPNNKFQDDPWNVLNKLLKYFYLEDISDELPFGAGAVGYLSYELGRFIENIPVIATDNPDIPDMYLGFYDSMIIWDHHLERSYITSSGLPFAAANIRAVPPCLFWWLTTIGSVATRCFTMLS